jgi:MFS family permease
MADPALQVPSARLPAGVVALGLVSLFMDTSSEMIHSTLPLFLTTVLGVGTVSVGVIEGVAEATASVTKVFGGAVSDWMRRRKALVLLGYGLSAVTKPLFPLATGVGTVLVARFVDRIGKGIRGAPRDALVADLTPSASHGAAYGLRQALDTVGAVAGPAVALALMATTHDDFRFVFWVAVLPAAVSVAIIVVGVREPDAPPSPAGRRFPIHRGEVERLRLHYWLVVAFGAVLTLARFSEAFLLLRAESVGLVRTYVPVVLVVMNVFYAASAYPFGRLSDRLRRRVLVAGIALLVAADVVLAAADGVWLVLVGAALWGLHMGATQGVLTAVVADAAPADLRATAFGLFHLVAGGALLAASVLAGWLWAAMGPAATFLAGAGFSLVALLGLGAVSWRSPERRPHA